MYKKEGKPPPKEMDDTVYYNRGLLQAAMHVEALRNAMKAQRRQAADRRRQVKKGFEMIKDFTLGGLVPPLQITADGSRRRRLGADLPGQGRQVRQGDRLVPRYRDSC